jgi:hypothetical protein
MCCGSLSVLQYTLPSASLTLLLRSAYTAITARGRTDVWAQPSTPASRASNRTGREGTEEDDTPLTVGACSTTDAWAHPTPRTTPSYGSFLTNCAALFTTDRVRGCDTALRSVHCALQQILVSNTLAPRWGGKVWQGNCIPPHSARTARFYLCLHPQVMPKKVKELHTNLAAAALCVARAVLRQHKGLEQHTVHTLVAGYTRPGATAQEPHPGDFKPGHQHHTAGHCVTVIVTLDAFGEVDVYSASLGVPGAPNRVFMNECGEYIIFDCCTWHSGTAYPKDRYPNGHLRLFFYAVPPDVCCEGDSTLDSGQPAAAFSALS